MSFGKGYVGRNVLTNQKPKYNLQTRPRYKWVGGINIQYKSLKLTAKKEKVLSWYSSGTDTKSEE